MAGDEGFEKVAKWLAVKYVLLDGVLHVRRDEVVEVVSPIGEDFAVSFEGLVSHAAAP